MRRPARPHELHFLWHFGPHMRRVLHVLRSVSHLSSNGSKMRTCTSVKNNRIITLTAGKKVGKAKITVKSKLGATTMFTVKVQKKKVTAKRIIGFKKAVSLEKGKSNKIPKAVVPVTVPDKAKYRISGKKVATVSKAGVVKAKKKGKATITVSYGKKSFKCKVTVK